MTKVSSLFLVSALVALLGAFLLAAPASHAASRTPISCSAQQSYFGQDTLLVMTKDKRLFRATSQGWQLLSPPATNYEVHVTPAGTIYLYNDYIFDLNTAIYRSTDGGTTWHVSGHVPGNGAMVFYYPLSPSPVPDLLFMGQASFPYHGALFRSTDGGVVWWPVQGVGRGDRVVFSPDFARDGLAFATAIERGGFSIWKTVDWGQTWAQVWDYLDPDHAKVGVAFSPHFAADRTAFSDAVDGQSIAPAFYKSTDGGATWFKVNDLAVDGPPAFSPTYAADRTFLVGQNRNLALSRDGGRTLTPIWDKANGFASVWGVRRQDPLDEPPLPLPAARRYYLPLVLKGPPPLEFWLVAQEAASGNCYLYRSRDDGGSWQEIVVP